MVRQGVNDRLRLQRDWSWRRGLPVLTDGTVTLRELRARDAGSLLAHVCKPSVLRYIAPSPSTKQGFKRFIRWTHFQRRAGLHACFGVVAPGNASAVGLLQIWPIELDFSTAEWGFVLSDAYWGTGLFVSGARLLLDFAFGTLGVHRLEARAAEANARGNGVLRKLGARREGVLRRAFRDGDELRDHVMWSILADEWLLRCESGAKATEEDETA